MANAFQVTLALLKPDLATNTKFVKSIEKLALAKNFYVVKRRQVRWKRKDAQLFYIQNQDKFYYERLVGFMSSSPVVALALAKRNAISEWRRLMGPTKVYQAIFTHPHTIRGQLGLTDTRNSVHGSDSPLSAKIELHHIFPDFDLDKWFLHEGRLFMQDHVTYDHNLKVHMPMFDSEEEKSKKLTPKDYRFFNMGSPEAWSNFYEKKNELVDWFADYKQLQNPIEEILSSNPNCDTVVDMGCGSSLVGPKLADKHPKINVYCIDSSIECLQTLGNNCTSNNCTFAISDVRNHLPFRDDAVDLIIDKGTSDAIARHQNGSANIKSMLGEAKRVLNKNGTLLQITTEPPETKLEEVKSFDENAKVSFVKLSTDSNTLNVYAYKVMFRPQMDRK